MNHIESVDIRIFPTKSRTNNTEFTGGTNWLTQYNITSIVNKLCGVIGFAISESIGSNENDIYEFNINGFIISIKNPVSKFNAIAGIPSSPNNGDIQNIYASIMINPPTDTSTLSEYSLTGDIDNEDNYEGVNFTTTDDSLDAYYVLHIATRKYSTSWSNWEIPEDTKIKFRNNVLRIDDGVLE